MPFEVGDQVWYTGPRDTTSYLATIKDVFTGWYNIELNHDNTLYIGVEDKYLSLILGNPTTKRVCECGASSVGSDRHTHWYCPLFDKATTY